jgi:hypothetical protein
MGDVLKIVGGSAATELSGYDGLKNHRVTAVCAGEQEARQAGWGNVVEVHGTNSGSVRIVLGIVELYAKRAPTFRVSQKLVSLAHRIPPHHDAARTVLSSR